MSCIVLKIGEYQVSNQRGIQLGAMGLGSCVALIMLSPQRQTVGMAHVALPNSTTDPSRGRRQPGYFADTAIPALLSAMNQVTGGRGPRYVVKLAGGANIMDPNEVFGIGKRNVLEIKKILWQHGMGPLAADVGGDYSRSVRVTVGDYRVRLTSPGRGTWEI